jgi:hypothetical protein
MAPPDDKKGPQAKIYEKINRQLGFTQKLLRDQSVLHETINSLLLEGIDAAAGAGERVDTMLKQQGIVVSNSFKGAAAGSAASARAIQADQESIADAIAKNEADATAAGKSTAAAGIAALLAAKEGTDSALADADKVLQFLGGDLETAYYKIQEGLGGDVLNTNRVITNDMSAFLMSETDRLKQLWESTGKDGNKAFQEVFPSFEKMLGYLDSHASKGLVAYQIMKEGNRDALLANQMYAKGLHISNDEMAELEIRQMSRSGKVSTNMMTQMVTYSQAVQKSTGMSAKDVGEAMSGLMRQSDKFANLTVKNAAKAVVAIGKIGLSVEDLTSMMGGFDGFEKSIESASTLQSVFGGVLDPIEMMFKSKNDPGGALMQLQEWWKSTGRDMSKMGAYGKQLINDVIPGLTVPKMERLFAAGAGPEEIQELAKELDGVKQLSGPEAMSAIQGDLALVQQQGALTTDIIGTRLAKALGSKLAPEAAKASMRLKQLSLVFPVSAAEGFAKTFKEIAGITETDLNNVIKNIGGLGDAFGHMLDKVGKLDTRNSLGPLVESLDKISKGLVDGIIKYFAEAGPALEKIFDQWGTWIGAAFNKVAKPNSPLPPVQLAILKYMNQTAVDSVKGFNDAFEPKNFTSLKGFQGAMKEAVSGKEVGGALKKFVKMTDEELKNLEKNVKSGDFDIGSQGMPFKRFDVSKAEGFQGISEKANKQLVESVAKLNQDLQAGPLDSVSAIYEKMTEFNSPLASMIGALKEAKVPFSELTDSTKKMLKDLGKIKDDDLLEFAYDGGNTMSKFKKDFGHIEDKLGMLKDTGYGMGSLSNRQIKDLRKSLKSMTGNYSEDVISAALKDTSKLQKIVNDEKKRLGDIVRLKSENVTPAGGSGKSGKKGTSESRHAAKTEASSAQAINRLAKAVEKQSGSSKTEVYTTIDLVIGKDKLRILTDHLLASKSTTGETIKKAGS